MELHESLPQVLTSGPDRDDLRVDEANTRRLTYSDLRELRFKSPEEAIELLKLYGDVPIVRDPGDVFLYQLVAARDAWFVRAADVGLLYFTNIIPETSATFSALFWDLKLGPDRVGCAQHAIITAFELFKIERLTAIIPDEQGRSSYRKFLLRIGFSFEGILRHSKRNPNGTFSNMSIFSLLRDEAQWPLSMISLER